MTIKTLILVSLALVLIAPDGIAIAKPKQCFTPAEEKAEQIVRYGLRLREGARICSDTPYRYGLMPLWQAVDQQYGPRFAQQKKIREQAFRREFGDDVYNRLEMWDGRVVFHYRNYPASPEFCNSISKTLKDMQKKGWNSFAKMAAKARDEVEMDFRRCH